MTIPKSELEVLHITETQRLETELKCSSSIECADCGTTTTDWVICSRCGKEVCSKHIDSNRGVCNSCKTHLGIENKNYLAKVELAESQRLDEIKRLQDAEPQA